jgi:hypothetical protein
MTNPNDRAKLERIFAELEDFITDDRISGQDDVTQALTRARNQVQWAIGYLVAGET